MRITTDIFQAADLAQNRIHVYQFEQLTGGESLSVREAVNRCIESDCTSMHINAKDVTCADLGGINEIIHASYQLKQMNKQLLFIYRRNSVVEKWVETTCLDKFITTAILPSA